MKEAPTPNLALPHHLSSPAPFRFRLLGEFAVALRGRRLSPPPYRTQGLLAALLLRPRPQRREWLSGLLFPELPERKGRERLSHLLWLLRRSLPDLPLAASPQQVCLPPEARWLDVEAFQQAAAGDDLQAWMQALALYRGDLLEGNYDDWLLAERETLYLQHTRLLHRACHELFRRGQFKDTLPLALRLVHSEPYDEHALRTLIRTYQALGRRGAALAAYERFVALAADELGAEPEPATQALAQAIRSSGPSLRVDPPLTISQDHSPEALLRRARRALWRGERATVEDHLLRLHAIPARDEDGSRLLEIDLALWFQEYEHARRLLETGHLHQAAKRVRSAQLALGLRDADKAYEVASQALILAHDAGDRGSELEALLTVAKAQLQLGHSAEALRCAGQAHLLAREQDSPQGLVQALGLEGFGHFYQGRYAQALSLFREARALALEHGLRYHLAMALRGIRLVQSNTNKLAEALATVRQELRIWRDLGIRRWEATSLEGLALVQDLLGRSADSLRTLERAQEISRQLGDPLRLATNQYNLACSLLYHHDAMAPRAIAHAGEALDHFRAHGRPAKQAAALTILGYALWVDRQHDAALERLREAYAVCERLGELARLPELLAYQGLAHLGLGHRARALALTRRAVISLAQGKVSDEVVPEIYYAHAMALSAHDTDDQAHDYFSRAYDSLLAGAAQLEDEEARQAFFHHNPTLRRLMQELHARGFSSRLEAGVASRSLPAARGTHLVQVRWTLDAGPADTALKQARGAIALRRARLSRLLREARAQGATPSAVHLAEALGVSKRTIQRDLAALRPSE